MNKRNANGPRWPSWLVATKVLPPQSSVQVIDRLALMEKLNAALGAQLTLVLASAGYGKTTLLAQWRDKLVAKDVPVAWLTLDEEDLVASRFVAGLIWSLSYANIKVDEFLEAATNDSNITQPRLVISALLNKLSTIKKNLVIILDDYYRAQSTENDDLVEFFIQHLPSNVHIIISSREVPKFGWTEFRTRGEILEFGVADLQFSFSEAKNFVYTDQYMELSDSQIDELVQKTEGWALGLQLAAIYLKKQTAAAGELPILSGRTAEVTEYLLEQVFQRQPPDIQDFLVQTSVFEIFNGDLANAVCDRNDSWAVMEQLYRRNLFTLFLDPEREWCRYHHLFADFLKEQLRRKGHAASEVIHRKAANWFSRHEMISEAVKHALQTGSLELVAQIVEEAGGWRFAITGQLSILRKVCSRLPEAIMRQYPKLWLGDILLSAKTGRTDDAQRKLRELDWGLANADAVSELAKAERIAIGVLIAGYEDRLVTTHDLEEIERSVRWPKFDDDLVLTLLNNYLCLLYLDAGQFNESIESGIKCKDFFISRGNSYSAKIIDTHIGQANLAQGHLTEATAIYRQMYDFARLYRGDGGDATAISGVLLAEAAYEKNDLESAQLYLDRSLPHIEKFDGWFDIYASGYITAASLSHITRGIDSAMAMLDQAEEISHRRNLGRLGRLVRLWRIRELTKAGDLRSAEAFATEFEPFEEAEKVKGSELSSWRLLEAAGLCLADFAIQRGEPERAIAILAPRQADAEAKGWVRSSMKLQIKLAVGFQAIGDQKEALRIIGMSLLKAAPQNFIRCYLDEGEPARQLLAALCHRDEIPIPAVKNFVNAILGEREVSGEILSKREREVLDLLVNGCSTKEMAFLLGLSANTIKYHRKRLFEKLGAASRSEVIAAARKLKI